MGTVWDNSSTCHLSFALLELIVLPFPSPDIVYIDLLIYLLSIPFPSPLPSQQTHMTELDENREVTGWPSATSPTLTKVRGRFYWIRSFIHFFAHVLMKVNIN